MSVRFSGDNNDKLLRQTSIPVTGAFTAAMFVELMADRNDYSTFIALTNVDGSDYFVFETDADGVTPAVFDGPGANVVSDTPLVVGTVYFIAITCDGATLKLYVGDADTGDPFTINTAASAASRAMTNLYVAGHNAASEPLNARITGLRIWDGAVSEIDLNTERTRINPERSVNITPLNSFFPMFTEAGKLLDASGSGRDLTAPDPGAWETEANPLQPWVLFNNAPLIEVSAPGGTVTESFAPLVPGFSGTAVFGRQGKNVVRITGLSLVAGNSGTIGSVGSGADVELPSTFPTAVDAAAAALGLTMADLVEVEVTEGASGAAQASHIGVDKTASPFEVTFTNNEASASGPLEIYLRYHHSIVR